MNETGMEQQGLASDAVCCWTQQPNGSSNSSGIAVADVQFTHPDIGAATADARGRRKGSVTSTGLTAKLHKHGLSVHPYTLRNEQQFVLEGCACIACEFDWLFNQERVDGGFADYPGTLHDWLVHRQQQQQ